LSEHRRVLREAFARHGGVEVDTQGDAFSIVIALIGDATFRSVPSSAATSCSRRVNRR
jgi:class 3 adenylate cyclase